MGFEVAVVICYSREKMSKSAAHQTTPQTSGGNETVQRVDSSRQQSQFVSLALTMGWQLALVVLIPVFIGVQMDKHFGTSYVWTFVGLGVALIGSGAVMWRAVQRANRLPVPKLTDEQRRKVEEQYAKDDE
jgi:hypothetical protein